MASFAKLGLNGEVLQVVSVNNDTIKDLNNIEQEKLGIDFLTELYNWPVWKQTSYNTRGGVHLLGGTPFRKNHAAIGYIYDESKDAFHPPRPYASWNLNEETCWWEPPVSEPALTAEELENGSIYKWNEDNVAWELYTPSTE